ncbi:MAG: type II CRISPR RNA-guided endonuclease Cas9 [Clostridia bacterium]|nr:type II CRISPR RNA-guided endonuclease Cas9 [Clostridia bacterium]MBQ9793266.1 type II CRISPR RNA-guided endonuclease Cas9 [Clostridia bacterium]
MNKLNNFTIIYKIIIFSLQYFIGTGSCGFCATDEDYNVLKIKGHHLWGVELFEEANDASERRAKRSARRLVQRQKERLALLQDLFYDEIIKKDKKFFTRLKCSSLWEDDKQECGIFSRNSLFFDEKFDDKEFYKIYPTIYHLRKALIQGPAKDIRFLYLAIHNMLKHRGNFLYESVDIGSSSGLVDLFENLANIIQEDESFEFLSFSVDEKVKLSLVELENEISARAFKQSWLENKFNTIFEVKNANQKALFKAIAGGVVNAKTIFVTKENELEFDCKIDNFAVEDDVYLKFLVEVENQSESASLIIDIAKQIYSKIIFKRILGNSQYFSFALVEKFENHKRQLKIFKEVMKNFYSEHYKEMFNIKDSSGELIKLNNYAKYIQGSNYYANKKEIQNKCTREDFYKYVIKVFDSKPEMKENPQVLQILKDIEENNFLLKLRTSANSVIPYQINRNELITILDNSATAYPFLLVSNEDGLTIKDKIISILEYRIPYFVGPLSTKNSKNSWIVKKLDEKVLPWNIEKVVDFDKCEEKFIERMQNSCTYLPNENVIPKNSLLYSEFMVLQELNNLRVNGERLNKEVKMQLLALFKLNGKLTIKQVKNHLRNVLCLYKQDDELVISGINNEFKSNLSIYKNFNAILDGKIEENIEMVESIINRATLVSDKNRLEKWITEQYGNKLTSKQIKDIKGLKISDWARLSRKFLDGIQCVNEKTGEVRTIIEIMRDESLNLMEVIYNYNLDRLLKREDDLDKITYQDVNALYCSPSVKRGIWQSIKIIDEIIKIVDKKPAKIFVEVTRHDEEKKEKDSRKADLQKKYKAIKNSIQDNIEELKDNLAKADNLKSERLYLYYTQLGKCMYTGEEISLDNLFTESYDVDHIIPQSKLKDDSLTNKVLVKRTVNEDKSNRVLSQSIIAKQKDFWQLLLKNDLISKEKFSRLIRTEEYTNEELKGFVQRQLVTTNQSVKAVLELLKSVYGDEAVVYSRAKHVSAFRNCEFKFDYNIDIKNMPYYDRLSQSLIKLRDLNDLHHAKDAYLNIVVGNVMNEKYTKKFYLMDEKSNYNFNINNAFVNDLEGVFVKDKHIPIIIDNMESNSPTVTYLPRTKHGAFYKETIWGVNMHQKDFKDLEDIKNQFSKKQSEVFEWDGGNLPLKSSANPLSNTIKYGRLSDATYSHFLLVEYDKKGKIVKEFIAVPLIYAKDFKSHEDCLNFAKLFVGNDNVKIIIPKIMVGTIIKIGNGYFKIAGNTGTNIKLHNFNQLYLPVSLSKYFKLVMKYNENIKKKIAMKEENEKIMIKTNRFAQKAYLNKVENFALYKELIKHISKSIYQNVSIGNIARQIKARKIDFMSFTLQEQINAINGLLNVINGKNGGDLSNLGESKNAGILAISKTIAQDKDYTLLFNSSTGFYKKEVKLN